MKTILKLSTFFIALCSSLEARTWNSSNGQSLEAKFISATKTKVTLKRDRDGKVVTFLISRLSENDQEFVRAQKSIPEPVAPIEGEYAHLITGDWVLAEYGKLPYAFYGSKELDGKKKYPLLICLHGRSSNNENGKQTRLAKSFISPSNYEKRPCLVLSPLCYQPFGATGGGWYKTPGKELLDLLNQLLKELPIIDHQRIYLTGQSMGGFGTWYLLKKEPELFAAGIPVASYFKGLSKLRSQPIWAFHGAKDKIVRVQGARKSAEELRRSSVFKYTEFPDAGHSIFGKVFSDEEVHEWLFAQRRR